MQKKKLNNNKKVRVRNLLVMLVKDFLHDLPKSFLPLEDSLLGDNIRDNVSIKTSLEEMVS
jgi:hypothetical protein